MKGSKMIYYVICLLALAAIMACGGSGGSGDGFGTSAGSIPVTSVGTISGFGSVYVGETKFETTDAAIYLDDDLGSQDDLRLGMVVKVKGRYDDDNDKGDADTIEYDSMLKGPISSITDPDPDTMTRTLEVMGKKVIVHKADTEFENTSFEELAEGMFIEVSGYLDSSGAIRATYIKKKHDVYDSDDDEIEIEGFITELNRAQKTFEIDGYIVDYSRTGFNAFSQPRLENGLFVEVEGKLEEPKKILAFEIEIEDDYPDQEWQEGEKVYVEGYIENVDSEYGFDVNGYCVEISDDTILENGTLDDIMVDNKVKVKGKMKDDCLMAEKIYFYLDYTEDFATALTKDDYGNVYVTGYSKGENTAFDYMTVKYDSEGEKLWARRYDSGYYDEDKATAIALYGDHVCVTGYSKGDDTDFDYATVCYAKSNGKQMWAERYDGYYNGKYYNSEDKAKAIAVDGDYVYVTGYSKGDDTDFDYATISYAKSNGKQMWAERYDGYYNGKYYNSEDKAKAIAVDGDYVYVTGYSKGDDTDFDYATISYAKSDGKQMWAERYDGYYNGKYYNSEDKAKAIAMDDMYVYVTGYSKGDDTDFDYATISYAKSDGKQMWAERYDGYYNGKYYNSEDKAKAIAVDGDYVYVTGYSKGDDTDFDYATISYAKSNGKQMWAERYDGYYNGKYYNSEDKAKAIAVDGDYVYVTGYSKGDDTDFDYATIGYEKSNGARKGLARYDGFYQEDKAQAIAVDGPFVWVTGYSKSDDSDYDYVTIKYKHFAELYKWEFDELWVARFDGYYVPYVMK